MISLLAKSLVFAGALILIWSLVIVRQLIVQLPVGHLRQRWHAMTIMVALFLVGYLGYLGAFWDAHSGLLDLIVPAVFFFGACFVLLTALLSLQTAMDMMRISVLERETYTDPLTGAFNRRYLDQRLGKEVATAQRYGWTLSVLLLDIDHFKLINDTYGHQVGDQVLMTLGKLMSKGLRDADVVARYGGEEFFVILPHTSLAGATDLAERMRKRIESHEFQLEGASGGVLQGGVTASIGVAVFGNGVDTAEKLVRAADEHLYEAKHGGRNRVVTGLTEIAAGHEITSSEGDSNLRT